MANKNEGEGALQRVLEELVTEFRGFSRIFSSFRTGAGGGAGGGGGGLGALAGGALGAALAIGTAGASAVAGAVIKPAKRLAKETFFGALTNRARFSDQESFSDSIGEAAFRAGANVPIIGGDFARAQGTIDRSISRTKAIIGEGARAQGGKIDEDLTRQIAGFLLGKTGEEERGATRANVIVDEVARGKFDDIRSETLTGTTGGKVFLLAKTLFLMNRNVQDVSQLLGLRD